MLVIDEAQHILDIGKILKLIVDTIDGVRILVTGSSVFDLFNRLGEPLVGRKSTIYLFPLSQIIWLLNESKSNSITIYMPKIISGEHMINRNWIGWKNLVTC